MKVDLTPARIEPNLTRAETQSARLLEEHAIDKPKFNVEALARAMGLEVKYGGLDKPDAWLFRKPKGKSIIRINNRVRTESRRRFSLAHELGHWVLHPHLTQLTACTQENLADYLNSIEETEANWFAATLLMPKYLISEAIRGRDPSFATIEQITEDFGTSRIAAARRFVELTKERVILVYSKSGQIIWRAKSKAAQYHALASETIPEDSWTFKTNSGAGIPDGHQPCLPDIWLKENPYKSTNELFEDVRVIDSLDATMTLLWFP